MALNGLPRFVNPLFKIERFKRVTNDGFFLVIEADDEKFDDTETRAQLNDWGAVALEDCTDFKHEAPLPKVFKTALILVLLAMLIPPVYIFKAQGEKNDAPRMHFNPDMDRQHKNKGQTISPFVENTDLFRDGRVMRLPVEGTVAWGANIADDEYEHGYSEPAPSLTQLEKDGAYASLTEDEKAEVAEAKWVKDFPVEVTPELMERGEQRFNIYCVVCHGYSGLGDGLVAKRADSLNTLGKAAWVQTEVIA